MISNFWKLVFLKKHLYFFLFLLGCVPSGSICSYVYHEENSHVCRRLESGINSLEQGIRNFLAINAELIDHEDDIAITCRNSSNCSAFSCLANTNYGPELMDVTISLNLCQEVPSIEVSGVGSLFDSFVIKAPVSDVYASKLKKITVGGYDGEVSIQVITNKKQRSITFNTELSMTFCSTSCQRFVLMTLPYQSLTKYCHKPRTTVLILRRSSRSTPEQMHTADKNKMLPTVIGSPCNMDDASGCGSGMSCTSAAKGNTCQCLVEFHFKPDPENKFCVRENPDSPDNRHEPHAEPRDYKSNSNSGVVSVLTILIVVGVVGAGVFYGVKYNVFQRVRSQLPVSLSLRCWPFRAWRRSPTSDNVSLAYEDENDYLLDDDDDPLLL